MALSASPWYGEKGPTARISVSLWSLVATDGVFTALVDSDPGDINPGKSSTLSLVVYIIKDLIIGREFLQHIRHGHSIPERSLIITLK